LDIIKKERRLQKAGKTRLRQIAKEKEKKEKKKQVQVRIFFKIWSSQEVFTKFRFNSKKITFMIRQYTIVYLKIAKQTFIEIYKNHIIDHDIN
jgi:hypothetical protein